jgi:ABC-2 type transport system ATP-binding protein
MWAHILRLREEGVTIILTTHYLEEAEEVADRIGIINKGKIILIEEKESLMKKLGKKELLIDLTEPLSSIPEKLAPFQLALGRDGFSITYTYNSPEAGKNPQTGVSELLFQLQANNIP